MLRFEPFALNLNEISAHIITIDRLFECFICDSDLTGCHLASSLAENLSVDEFATSHVHRLLTDNLSEDFPRLTDFGEKALNKHCRAKGCKLN